MKDKSLFVKKMTALATALLLVVVSSVTRVEAAPPPDLTSQQIEAVVEEVYNGFATFDVQQVVSYFAADAVVEDPVGTPPMQGTQAIINHLQNFPILFDQVKLYSNTEEAACCPRYFSRTRYQWSHDRFSQIGDVEVSANPSTGAAVVMSRYQATN